MGCAIAERLARSSVSVCVIERHHDVADETSKANTGLADSGWECETETLEASLVRRSSEQWEEVCERLDVPFQRSGALCVARTTREANQLDALARRATENGVSTRRIGKDETLRLAPYVTREAVGALHVPNEGIIDSIRLTLSYAELAAANGARFLLGEPLIAASRDGQLITELRTPSYRVRPRFVVNAAGLGADEVSRLLGAEEFDVWPRRGEYLLLDREAGRDITIPITQVPTEHTRGVMVVPSTHGSVLLGPTAEDDRNKNDRSTHAGTLGEVLEHCRSLVPSIRSDHIIKSFAGLRPASERTYRIEASECAENLVQACGIRSTGVSGSYAIGEYVAALLTDVGLDVTPRENAAKRLPKRLCLRNPEAAEEISRDPLGRTVVCACEKVTALEIHEALRSRIPARSLNGIAKRTRAGWGRCQGSACLSGISFIASMYMKGKPWEIPVGEPGSTLGVGEAGD